MGSILIAATYLLVAVVFVVGGYGIVTMFRLHKDSTDGPRLSDLSVLDRK